MPTAETSAKPKRRVWHYLPYGPKRTDLVIKHVSSCVAAIAPWVASARAEQKYWPFRQSSRVSQAGEPQHGFPRTLVPGADKTDDDIRCDVANALQYAMEWDGFLLADKLHYTCNWPCDAELVQLLHRWSCDLRRAEIAAYRASKEAKEAKKTLTS